MTADDHPPPDVPLNDRRSRGLVDNRGIREGPATYPAGSTGKGDLRVGGQMAKHPEANPDMMMDFLEIAVPFWQDRHRASNAHLLNMRRQACAAAIGEHGAALQFRTRHSAEAFDLLAEGLAIASFCPGGITFRGRHWTAGGDGGI